MAQSLDNVLQPDGTYKWQLVDLNDAYVGRGDAAPAEPPKAKRRTKTSETPTETPEF